MRRAALVMLLFASVALAHVIAFSIELPAFVGNHPGDGGIYTLQWVDQVATGPKATISLWATRAAWSPFEAPDASLLIWPDIPYVSPVNLFDWDTSDAGEGCWQPYALIDDPIEGFSVSKAEGRITVSHSGNVPPSIWVTTPRAALPDRDARLTLDWVIEEPDDPSTVKISWRAGDGEAGTLATALPLSAGTQTASYTFDVHRLPPKPVWLRVEISSGDGGWCDAWWGGFVTGRSDELVDGGLDAGSDDAGSDAGDKDAGSDAGPPGPRGGCGCQSAEGLWLGVLALLKKRRKMPCRSR